MPQKGLVSYLAIDPLDLGDEDLFVNITLYRVPSSLVREFTLKVARKYSGGISEAILDLMEEAISK